MNGLTTQSPVAGRLPGDVISFYPAQSGMPFNPAHPALAGRGTFRSDFKGNGGLKDAT